MNAETTIENLQKMSVEEIIHLPEFLELKRHFHFDEHHYGPSKTPHWEIRLRAKPIGGGKFKCYNLVTIFDTLVIYKLITN